VRVLAAILAAGKGERFGADKTLLLLGGKPVWQWSFDAFASHPEVDETFLVTSPERVASLQHASRVVIAGGKTRPESSRLALEYAVSRGADVLLLQDAARPFTSKRLISAVIAGVREAGAAAPGVPVTDTIKECLAEKVRTIPRDNLIAMQTPQGAVVELLSRAHKEGPADGTDDMALIEAIGVHPRIVPGDSSNFKITQPADFERALAHVGAETRTGLGYDVHAFSPDPSRPLWLGGVHFDDHPGLQGHSDADVLLHAVTDALLGAASLGDIGVHFPPGEPEWKDRESSFFLRRVAALLRDAGWRVVNVDATCIAETPKIMRRSFDIRSAIATAIGVDSGCVSVKATTNEGLGSIGRGEGIAAFAIATITRARQS
jgi:2-C-methyl-D-erythritol 4-phosphate cytidylyltransferase/2-C-methyl-D-erythritol 2,4-cyclodiphosphate synthase